MANAIRLRAAIIRRILGAREQIEDFARRDVSAEASVPVKKLGLLVGTLGLATSVAPAQAPEVGIYIDAIGSFVTSNGGAAQWRYYSVFGTPSIAALRFSLEPGFSAFVSERLQRIPHDGDPDQLDEFYIEDRGIWRIGKQTLPFGTTQVLHESAIGARADLTLPLYSIPASLALCDAGAGRQRGLVGRFGPTSYGLSFAVGEHFGISGDSLTEIRLPSASPGLGQGWDYAVGADITRRVSGVRLRAEGLLLRGGVSPLDPDVSLLDLSASIVAAPFDSFLFGYTREATNKLRVARFVGSLPLADHVWLKPYVRFRDSRLWNIGCELNVRL